MPERPRTLGGVHLGLRWGSLGVSLLVVVLGVLLVPALSLPDALVAVDAACLNGNLMLAVAGAIGAQAGVPAMVWMRVLPTLAGTVVGRRAGARPWPGEAPA